MISQKRSCSSAVIGAKSARACDSCLLKRARWYCAADDAFLCQGCDSSVHSANQLASRHERVRLNASSSSMITQDIVLAKEEDQAPAWHRGFTRKARTPRNPAGKSCLIMVEKKDVQREKLSNKFSPLIVPEMGSDESPFEETEEHLLCRVPVFDPFDTEFCNESNEREKGIGNEIKELFDDGCPELDGFQGFLPSDMELAEFAADVESLLGREGNEDYKVRPETLSCFEAVKMEEEEEEIEAILACQFDPVMDMARESLDWQFKYNSPIPSEEEDLKAEASEENTMMTKNSNSSNRVNMERTKMLTLNYEGVITAWASHGCPWTNGRRPQFDPDASLSDFMGISLANINQQYGDRLGGLGAGSTGGNEREARVSRYREKRRTRLFSKKIRYEVRKLNAEKRPRMKGRFVKRSSFAETTFS